MALMEICHLKCYAVLTGQQLRSFERATRSAVIFMHSALLQLLRPKDGSPKLLAELHQSTRRTAQHYSGLQSYNFRALEKIKLVDCV
jgi:hypothetical protein